MTLGLAMQAAGLAWVALLAGHTASYAEIVVPLVIAGVGISMAIPTMPLAVMGAVAPRDMGTASGVFNMLQRFGGVVAVAVASAVFVSNGHLGTAVSFDNGFRPALLVSAGASVLGSVSAILARRARAKAVDLTGAGLVTSLRSPGATPHLLSVRNPDVHPAPRRHSGRLWRSRRPYYALADAADALPPLIV